MKKLSLTTALLLLTSVPALAAPPQAMVDYVMQNAPAWLSDPVVVNAIKAQNTEHDGITEGAILDLDTQWRDEVSSGSFDLVSRVLEKPVSEYLSGVVTTSQGLIREVFVMDAHGLNVGQSGATSDYWQGDEDKFQKTYPLGASAIHISDVEFDESAQTYISQVSLPVIEPATGEVIGAVTFGVDASSFF